MQCAYLPADRTSRVGVVTIFVNVDVQTVFDTICIKLYDISSRFHVHVSSISYQKLKFVQPLTKYPISRSLTKKRCMCICMCVCVYVYIELSPVNGTSVAAA